MSQPWRLLTRSWSARYQICWPFLVLFREENLQMSNIYITSPWLTLHWKVTNIYIKNNICQGQSQPKRIRPFCASHTPDAPLRTHMARSLSLTIFESRNWAVSLHRVHQGSSGLCLWLRGHFLSLLEAEISMIIQIIMFFDQQSWTELFWKLVRCGNYVIYVCVWWVLSRSCGLYLNKTIFRQRKFTLSPWPQVL